MSPLQSAGSTLLVATLVLGGCRLTPPTQSEAPPTPPEAGTPSPEPSVPSPAGDPSPTTNRLPTTLMKEWQPLSKVLVAFGPMTISATQVQWGSGQTSAYSLVSIDGGYLLKLDDNPAFYDSPNQYIKLIPKPESPVASASIEVAFFTDKTQVDDDEYVMYGSYFAE